MFRRRAPKYDWEIKKDVEDENFKKSFLKLYSKELNLDNRYISDEEKTDLKDKYNSYSNVLDEIIDTSNKNFIFRNKTKILKEFEKILDLRSHYIKDEEKFKFKLEYTICAFDFYDELNLDYLINQFNSKIIRNEKPLVERRFKKALRTYNGYIKGTDKLKLRSKFNTDYYDFYDELNFDKIIDETNDKLSEKQKVEILNDFKDKLDLPRGYISYSEKIKIITNFPDYIFDMDELIENYNKFYIEEQMELNKEFFENIADRTLDNDQIVAVLTDDDNTQIVAGAGTGKTLTIQAKVKFLIEKQNISPSDILCITFSNTARNDLERKIKKTIGNKQVNIIVFL